MSSNRQDIEKLSIQQSSNKPMSEVQSSRGDYIDRAFLKHYIDQVLDIMYNISMLDDEIESYKNLGLENEVIEAYKRRDSLNKSLKEKRQSIHELQGYIKSSECSHRLSLIDSELKYEIKECSEVVNKIRFDLSNRFLIDTGYCDALEEIILKLANIDEKPAYCGHSHDINIHDIGIKPEIKHTSKNSVFFKLGLLKQSSMIKLTTFLEKNHVEFYDYTDKVISNTDDKTSKLICINSRGLLRILYPKIIEYLNKNPNDINRYRRITLQNYNEMNTDLTLQLSKCDPKKRAELLKDIDFLTAKIKKIKNTMNDGFYNSISDSAIGFFNKPVVKAGALGVIGAVITATLLYR